MEVRLEDDVEIQRAVLEEFDWDPEVNAADVGVEVHEGVVTLQGTVETQAEKSSAERAALRVYGVRAVANDLEVRPVWSARRDDTDIATEAANRLEWSATVPEEQIEIIVEDGRVTLRGEVSWNHQRLEAERLVRGITGVRGVVSALTVKSPPHDAGDITEKIRSAFMRHALIDAHQISVEVEDGVARLSGTVKSWFERQEAERAAWGPGIEEVENAIQVRP